MLVKGDIVVLRNVGGSPYNRLKGSRGVVEEIIGKIEEEKRGKATGALVFVRWDDPMPEWVKNVFWWRLEKVEFNPLHAAIKDYCRKELNR